jgi:PX domain
MSSSFLASGDVTVGDLFGSETLPGQQIVSRAWHFRSTEAGGNRDSVGHKVIFRHCLSAGRWSLIIDGVPYKNGLETVMTRKFEVSFSIDTSHKAVIVATAKNGIRSGFSHRMTLDDIEVLEMKRNAGCLNVGDKPPEHISIPDTRLFNDGIKDVTLFQIFIKPFQGGQIIAERRFSEFLLLSKLIGTLKDVLAGVLPVLPRRVFTPWTDQHSAEFINQRRIALQCYLQSLLSNSRICTYSEFLCFIGLDPITGDALQEPLSCRLRLSDDNEEGFQI